MSRAVRCTVTVAAALLLLHSSASSSPPSKTQPVRVQLPVGAKLVAENAIVGRVKVACPAGLEILEAHVTVSQDDQRLFGQGPISGVHCTGKPRWYRYQARAYEHSFHTGSAYVSAYVLAGAEHRVRTASGGDTRVVKVR